MKIPSKSYENIHESFHAAIEWMNSLGVRIESSRLNNYESILEYWKNNYRVAKVEEGVKIFPDFVGTLNEVNDFIDIFNSFKDTPIVDLSSLVEKLNNGVGGPLFASLEKGNNSSARNFLFELAVAARAHRPLRSVKAALDAPTDTGVYIEGKKIWIECKRISSHKKLEANIRDASRQLENVLSSKIGASNRGMVALDITKIIKPEDTIFVAKNDISLISSTQNLIDEFIKKNHNVWNSIYRRRTDKIIGTLFRIAFMSSSEARGLLVHTTQWAITPSERCKGMDEQVLKNLVSALNDE